ncbi:MAG: excinuclease ABC subunit UvrC [Desulfobulbaceae bacterium]|nr:excinuclease ABC subunit UvrC [Desulfobulbaceae bacterium]
MRDGGGKVLYVGKARDLRARLASHRNTARVGGNKTAALLDKTSQIETILTATEKEALLLESSLIKKYRPRYNVILRDDKSYPYLKVTSGETWPRVLVTRRRLRDGARYFGPYSSATAMHETLRLVRALFPLRTCKGQEVPHRARPCLNHQLGLCPAPCSGEANREAYLQQVREVVLILEGRRRELLTELEQRMRRAASALEFEQAAGYRDLLNALRETLEKQVVAAGHHRSFDVFGLVRQGVTVVVTALFIREGLVNGQQNFVLEDPLGDDSEVLAACLSQFYQEGRLIPAEILLGLLPDRAELLEEYLAELRAGAVTIRQPQRGEGLALVHMAAANGAQYFADRERKAGSSRALLLAVAKHLQLATPPSSIECLDISNISGQLAVGSLIAFRDGEPDPANYRHYRIQGGDTPDDYGMIREVLLRRFAPDRKREGPDLLLIDGGKGQLNVAREVLAAAGFSAQIALAAIAKEKAEEGEKIFLPGRKNPLALRRHDPVLLFLMRVRDEAHRFGVTFHRRLRRNKDLSSGLIEVPGLGPARSRLLLRKFGSLKRVAAASEAELAQIKGIGPELARVIYRHFNP